MSTVIHFECRNAAHLATRSRGGVGEIVMHHGTFGYCDGFASDGEHRWIATGGVSLEQLVSEGRERPMTMSGNIAVPIIDEVEELGAESLMPAEEPLAVAVMDEPAPVAVADNARVGELEAEVARLHAELASTQDRHRGELEQILRDLDDLAGRVRMHLGA